MKANHYGQTSAQLIVYNWHKGGDMRTIDLSGPEGNGWNLIGLSRSWAKQMGLAGPALQESQSYVELLNRFDSYWKNRIEYTFLHDPRKEVEDDDEN